jgi:hypothetical protein
LLFHEVEYRHAPTWLDLLVMTVMFVVCFVAGTILFVRHERNR